PSIGIAMFAAAGAAEFARNSPGRRALAAVAVLLWLLPVLQVTVRETRWWRAQSESVRALVTGVQDARRAQPGKPVAVQGVTADLFDLSFGQSIFEFLAIPDVYLTPANVLTGTRTSPAPYVLDAGV